MAFNFKACLLPDRRQQLLWKTDIHVHDAMALNTGKVVMVLIAAGPVSVAAIGEFNAVQQPLVDQHFNGPEDGRTTQVRIMVFQVMPQLFHSEICAAGRQLGNPAGDLASRPGLSPRLFLKGGAYLLGRGTGRPLRSHG
jgi:hypothetical protein